MSKFCPVCHNDSLREHTWSHERDEDQMYTQWRCEVCGFETDVEDWEYEATEDESDDE